MDVNYILVKYDSLKINKIYKNFMCKLHDRSIKMLLLIDVKYFNNIFHIIEIIIELGFDGIIVNDEGGEKTKDKVILLRKNLMNYPEPYNTYDWFICIEINNNMCYINKSQEKNNIVDFPGSKFVKYCFEQFILDIIEIYIH